MSPEKDITRQIGRELKKYFHGKGMRQEDIATRFGVSQAYVSGLMSGKRPFGKRSAARWAEEFGFSEGWLLTGEGDMLKNSEKKERKSNPHVNMIPLLPERAFAGRLMAYSESVMPHDCEKIPSPYPQATLAIRVSGKSMEPEIPEGSVVFINKISDREFIPWGFTHVLDTVNGIYIKNIYELYNNVDAFEARSINPDYPPFKVPYAAVYGFYQVLGILRSFGAR